MNGARALAGARFTSWLRGGAGGRAVGGGRRPREPLVLYEFEACPFCRRVREALSELDLEVSIRPCPKGGRRFRDAVVSLGGVEQFPFLVDPDAGRAMYESRDIVDHLHREYGRGLPPQTSRTGPLETLALVASGLGRGTAGSRARASKCPDRPLVFEGFEAQPESRLVREVLCELELPYSLRPAAPGSARRTAGGAGIGVRELPRLADPNTGTEHTGWRAIVRHLEQTWAQVPRRV